MTGEEYTAKYYSASLSMSLRVEIEKLFERNKRIQRMYDNNKIKFIEDSIRRQILFFDGMYKSD